ncbi:MAG: type I-U CRISPR-associated protein Cas7 [Phycisphaerae bacterium]|jgi:CRISPR-associated protein Csb1
MSELLSKYDPWLEDGGPAALVIREHLVPVEGRDGVVFPATFAAGDGFPGGYNIDGPFNGQPDGENVCLIDSVGSQANRVEPVFAQQKYQGLVPQITIEAGDEKQVNLLEAGHRAGDAIARCTELADAIENAFLDVLQGDARPLAKIAPTSLVFGVWDSRNTQAKLPRIVGSTIRAFNVRRLTRGAVYIPPLDYAALEVFSEEDKAKAEGNKKSPLAQRGFVHNPASGSHGGVIATGGIRRDATLNLAALRLLKAGNDDNATLALRRYILGLSLVAFTHPSAFVGYLRQGCTLVLDPDAKPAPRELSLVRPDGKREPQTIAHDDALAFAKTVAENFVVGESKTVRFNKDAAKKDVADAKPDKKGKKGKKGAAPESGSSASED